MSKKATAVTAAVAALMLAGCSTAPVRSDAPKRVIDHAKVAAVDEAAQVSGTRVVWVNHPMVREGEENKR